MAKYVRVVAEHAGDKLDPQDARWKIVFDGIEVDGKLKPHLYFGFTSEVDDDDGAVKRWPFLLEPATENRGAVINFGPEQECEAVNIFDRKLALGELFTRGSKDDQSTYRIIKIGSFEFRVG